MIIALYIAAAVVVAVGSLYFAWRNRDFRKFLAGAFFVASGILFYLYLADVSVPLLGTGVVETPRISAVRSIVHFFSFWSVSILASSGRLGPRMQNMAGGRCVFYPATQPQVLRSNGEGEGPDREREAVRQSHAGLSLRHLPIPGRLKSRPAGNSNSTILFSTRIHRMTRRL